MAEHLAAEDGVDAIAGVQYQVLPQPCHDGAEYHKHHHSDGDNYQGALGLVDYYLVNYHLGEKRGGEADELDDEGSCKHLTPNSLVLQELRNKPAETELF